MKVIKLVLFLILFSSFDIRKTMPDFIVYNSIGDSVNLFRETNKEFFYVIIIEPSCTGCKDNLADVLKKKSNLIILTNYYLNIENRKISNKFFSGIFTNLKKVYFLSSNNQSLKSIGIIQKGMPCVIRFSKKSKQYTVFNYDDIFDGMAVKNSFISHINN